MAFQFMDSFVHLLLFLLPSSHLSSSPKEAGGVLLDITKFGAVPDGKTYSTKAFQSAWDAACGSPGPATILVPAGVFLVDHLAFHGPCQSSHITVQIDGTIIAPSDYVKFGNVRQWMLFDRVEGVSVNGGTIDGRGKSLWDCKNSGGDCPEGSTSLTFRDSKDVTISGVRSMNSKLFHIVIEGCERVQVQRVKVEAPEDSPNTDGIHVQRSTAVTITSADIGTGDDCVSVGPDTTGLWIDQMNCGPGHGISIGSLGKTYDEKGVENVTVKRAVLKGTQNGVRIKSWGRPSTGFVRGVFFQDIVMQNVKHPIIIDQNYCPHGERCPGQNSGVKISQVTYSNIHGSSNTKEAVIFDCSESNPCTEIKLEDMELMYENMPAKSLCSHAVGTSSGYINPPSCLQ